MDIEKLRGLITIYKANFSEIHDKEIYKWRATQAFQDRFNLEADNFALMLKDALEPALNLVVSGQYFPLRMLMRLSERNPDEIRKAFRLLFNEELDLLERVQTFQTNLNNLTWEYFGKETQSYQDDRAIFVYLSLKYPERYYLYKYEMFRSFVSLINYPYKPISRKKYQSSNIQTYINLCDIISSEIQKDKELIKLHRERLTINEYQDREYHILTQDFIYAVTQHLSNLLLENSIDSLPTLKNNSLPIQVDTQPEEIVFAGRFINFVENERENKRIGNLGELFVFSWEQQKLIDTKFTPTYDAKLIGDGLGYDIGSFETDGQPLFIEVKTTKGGHKTPFFVTQTELKRSVKEGNNYRLYRLYNFNEEKNTADFFIIEGSLEAYCINPTVYKVKIK